MDSHLVHSPQEQASVGPGWPRVLASAFPPLTPLCVPAGLARKPRLPGSWPAFASRSRRAAVCTWWARPRPRCRALGSGSAVRSGGPCIACSAVSSWDSRATHGDREDEPTQEAWRAQGRPRRAGAGPAAHRSCSSGGFRRAWCVQPPAAPGTASGKTLARLGWRGEDPTAEHLPGAAAASGRGLCRRAL